MNKEKQVVKEYVQRIIDHLVPTDVTLLYVYHTTNNYLTEKVSNPIVTIDVTKQIFNGHKYQPCNEMVILDVRHFNLMNYYLGTMDKNGLIDSNTIQYRKHLVIVPDLNLGIIKLIFYKYFHVEIIDLIIITFDSKSINDTIKVFTSDPHNPENQCGKFVKALQSYNYSTINLLRKPGIWKTKIFFNWNCVANGVTYWNFWENDVATFNGIFEEDKSVFFVIGLETLV
ncbi:hypothetical protein FQA39_LY11943 [Lamprigera yunnana]|nr:hypothetical protein FQA39_LY11943 [Lamprigera yunnana]